MNEIKSLREAISESVQKTQTAWAISQGTTKKTAQDLINAECIVIDGTVYRPTKYKVALPIKDN